MSMTFATNVVIDDGQSVQTNKVLAPTASGGSTYGVGTSGQVLKTNGTNVYWGDESGGGGSGDVSTITMNGTTLTPTSGDIDLGTVITSNPVMTGADGTDAGTAGLVPAPAAANNQAFLCGDGTWKEIQATSDLTDATVTFVTTVSTTSDGQIKATRANIRAASDEVSGAVTTGSQSFAGNKTFTGIVRITNETAASSTAGGCLRLSGGLGCAGNIYGAKVYNAVWNDYAECRKAETLEPGRCVTETESGVMVPTDGRLQAGCRLTSDTFGTCMGETDEAKTPIAVAGRVLAYPFRDRNAYHLGDAVCSAPNGTVDVMTREEICEYPERIVGTVSELPEYDTWIAGTKEAPVEIPVNGRIWIYVR